MSAGSSDSTVNPMNFCKDRLLSHYLDAPYTHTPNSPSELDDDGTVPYDDYKIDIASAPNPHRSPLLAQYVGMPDLPDTNIPKSTGGIQHNAMPRHGHGSMTFPEDEDHIPRSNAAVSNEVQRAPRVLKIIIRVPGPSKNPTRAGSMDVLEDMDEQATAHVEANLTTKKRKQGNTASEDEDWVPTKVRTTPKKRTISISSTAGIKDNAKSASGNQVLHNKTPSISASLSKGSTKSKQQLTAKPVGYGDSPVRAGAPAAENTNDTSSEGTPSPVSKDNTAPYWKRKRTKRMLQAYKIGPVRLAVDDRPNHPTKKKFARFAMITFVIKLKWKSGAPTVIALDNTWDLLATQDDSTTFTIIRKPIDGSPQKMMIYYGHFVVIRLRACTDCKTSTSRMKCESRSPCLNCVHKELQCKDEHVSLQQADFESLDLGDPARVVTQEHLPPFDQKWIKKVSAATRATMEVMKAHMVVNGETKTVLLDREPNRLDFVRYAKEEDKPADPQTKKIKTSHENMDDNVANSDAAGPSGQV
jgi:hypothetical protein